MIRIVPFLATAALAAIAASSTAASTSVGVAIRHQVRGCHTWVVAGRAAGPSQRLDVSPGTSLAVSNYDVMPHTLVQLAGPHLALRAADMGYMGARTTVVLKAPGVYRFKTVAGEDYPMMVAMMGEPKTIGEDNVLKLTVVVR